MDDAQRLPRERRPVGVPVMLPLIAALLLLASCSGSEASRPAEPTVTSTTAPPTTGALEPDSTLAPSSTMSGSNSPAIELVCLPHDGEERCAEVYWPDGDEPRPIVLDLHGWGSSPEWQRERSGFAELAAAEGFIAAWPTGLGNSFNAGGICCPPAVGDRVDDVGFLRNLTAELAVRDGHHDGRVFASGLSNGCAMAQRFGVEAADLVTAVACFAFYLLIEPPTSGVSVPMMEIHAVNDPIVAYDGAPPLFPGALENLATWALLNGCDVTTPRDLGELGTFGDSANEVAVTGTTYPDCEAETVLVTLSDGGHLPYPAGGVAVDTTRLAWDFLSRQTG